VSHKRGAPTGNFFPPGERNLGCCVGAQTKGLTKPPIARALKPKPVQPGTPFGTFNTPEPWEFKGPRLGKTKGENNSGSPKRQQKSPKPRIYRDPMPEKWFGHIVELQITRGVKKHFQ